LLRVVGVGHVADGGGHAPLGYHGGGHTGDL